MGLTRLTKWSEIICDYCGCASHFLGNQWQVERQYQENGGVITSDKKYYCDKKCYHKSKENM